MKYRQDAVDLMFTHSTELPAADYSDAETIIKNYLSMCDVLDSKQLTPQSIIDHVIVGCITDQWITNLQKKYAVLGRAMVINAELCEFNSDGLLIRSIKLSEDELRGKV